MPREVRHVPVLMEQVLAALNVRPGHVVVDCTLGLGGHSSELLRRVGPTGRLISIDFDPANIAVARSRLEAVRGGGRFDVFHNNFAALPTVLREAGVALRSDPNAGEGAGTRVPASTAEAGVDVVLADVGVASTQIDDPDRGFSYRHDGPLDMRMDPTRGRPASELLAKLSERELAAALLELGDETDAPQIARLIVQRRAHEAIRTTAQLTQIVCDARDFTLVRAAGAKLHPAARTFQALRILVNRELANLQRLLDVLPDCLRPGGVGAIISFHSGEDRLVKSAFRDGLHGGLYSEVSPDPLTATEEEQRANPRSRSAKLRWARRA